MQLLYLLLQKKTSLFDQSLELFSKFWIDGFEELVKPVAARVMFSCFENFGDNGEIELFGFFENFFDLFVEEKIAAWTAVVERLKKCYFKCCDRKLILAEFDFLGVCGKGGKELFVFGGVLFE